MKKIRELIRLRHEKQLTHRQIGAVLNISSSTVSYYLQAIATAGLSWPLADSVTDQELIATITPHCNQLKQSRKFKEAICWQTMHQQMQHKHMTIKLLYEEYIQDIPAPHYSYAHFTRAYKVWRKQQQISMPMSHKYGDKALIDFAGDTIPIYSHDNTIKFNAQIFVAVLAASNYTFILATPSQRIPDWIDANAKALEFFGGVPALLVPDNLKSAITDACKYDPLINPTYSEMAQHYNTTILPARAYKPKDKASVENTVLIVERWIMARLRKQKFYSLGALNNKLRELNIALNNKPFQKKAGSRYSEFIEHEQSTLRALPIYRYELATFKIVKVQKDYHISVNNHFYSVPYSLIGMQVECRLTNHTVEIIYDGQRITSHIISNIKGGRTTLECHMPKNHLEHKNWSYDVLLLWAKNIGSGVFNLSKEIIAKNKHKEQTYRFHLGLKKLAKQYSNARLESACLRALAIGSLEYKSISSILSKQLDLQSCIEAVSVNRANAGTIYHSNIRGKNYFQQQLKEST